MEPEGGAGGGTRLDGATVLLISMYYAPEHSGSAPYTTDTAEFLAAQGGEVHVVTTWPHYPAWKRPVGVRNRWANDTVCGVTIHRVPAFIPRKPTLLRRGLYEASFLAFALPAVARVRPDVVIGCMPTLLSGVLSAAVASVRGVRLIQLVQDLYTSAADQAGLAGAKKVRGLLALLEGFSLRRADAVSAVSEAFLPVISDLGVTASRVKFIPNWSRLTPGNIDRQRERQRLGWGERTIILHTGNMGVKQGLEELGPIIRTLASTDPKFFFAFVGDGSKREVLIEALRGTPNAEVLPPLPDKQYLQTLMAADVLLVHERGSVKDMSLPSKLTSYFAAGRPVVAVAQPGSATANEVERAGAGVSIPPGDGAAFALAVKTAVANAQEFGRRARAYHASALHPRSSLESIVTLVTDGLAPEASRGQGPSHAC